MYKEAINFIPGHFVCYISQKGMIYTYEDFLSLAGEAIGHCNEEKYNLTEDLFEQCSGEDPLIIVQHLKEVHHAKSKSAINANTSWDLYLNEGFINV